MEQELPFDCRLGGWRVNADALEVGDVPELSDELSMAFAVVRRGERSRMFLSDCVGSMGCCSLRRGLVRSLATVSVHSDSEIGE